MATSMPDYISENINGFVPSNAAVSRNLRVDSASVSSQISSMDISNDISSDDLSADSGSENTDEEREGKSQAYNTSSGKVLGEVSDKAIDNDNPTISCDDPEADCDKEPTLTPTLQPFEPPKITITPTPTIIREPKPSIIPEPTITIIPLPSKYPTFYPCYPVRLGGESPDIVMPCPGLES